MNRTKRVVSLLPSATEIVCSLGFAAQLVGRSHECDHPAEIGSLPVCTAPRINPAGASGEIDREIRALLEQALSIYTLDVDRLRDLRPDVIVTQTQCDVCAVPLEQVEQAAAECLHPDASIVALEPVSLAAVWSDLRKVAAALDAVGRGEVLVRELQRRMGVIEKDARKIGETPTVATIEWIEPLMVGGNWMPELVDMAGGKPVLAHHDRPSPVVDWEALRAEDPDVIIIIPCGFDLVRTRAEATALTRLPGWSSLKAVRNGRVALADGHQFFNRPGPRLVESLEILAEFIHPGRFDFGHEGSGWELMVG